VGKSPESGKLEQNALFCPKNIGLAKEPDHSWRVFIRRTILRFGVKAIMKDR